MTEADQKREDDVLRRMLATKPKPHKAKAKSRTRRELERPPEDKPYLEDTFD